MYDILRTLGEEIVVALVSYFYFGIKTEFSYKTYHLGRDLPGRSPG